MERRDFIRTMKENGGVYVEHPYLKNSEMEMQVMDEVRRQQEIAFPADRK